jgi:hypothetical protein
LADLPTLIILVQALPSDHGLGARRAAPELGDEFRGGFVVEDSGDNRLSRRSTIIGLAGLTAVFGMGTGVAPPVWSPEKWPAGGQAAPATSFRRSVVQRRDAPCCERTGEWRVLHHVRFRQITLTWTTRPIDRMGCFSCLAAPRSGWSSCLAVRTGRLKRSRAVHARPIDLVVFQEPTHFCWKPHLGGGFALRCLQRLSCPDLATRRCPERDSRHTRGRSSPILSY